MKIKLFFIVFNLISLSCSNTKRIQKIELSHVDLDIFTSIVVKCDLYEDYFGADVNSISLNTQKSEVLYKELESFVKRAKTFNDVPDVRIKAKLFFTNDQDEEVCIGDNLILYKGNVYIVDDEFRYFIKNFIIEY